MAKKIAVVICSYMSSYGRNDPKEDLKSMLYVLQCHEKFKDTTIPYDLWIVDNGSNYKEWTKLLKNYPNVIVRKNTGASFGAYKSFARKFADTYDYFLFHEHDCAPTKPGWLNEIVARYKRRIGVVGLNHRIYQATPEKWFVCGGFYFISSKVIKECGLRAGYKPRYDSATKNELIFVENILKAGYKVSSYDRDDYVYSYGRNIIQGDVKTLKEKISPIICINSYDKKIKKVYKYLEEYGIYRTT